MNIKEFAEMLNGREYGKGISPREAMDAREAGLVIVCGASDDLIAFCGAIHDKYETDIPHETFDIYEDGEKFCRGIVFSIDSLKQNKELFMHPSLSIEAALEHPEEWVDCFFVDGDLLATVGEVKEFLEEQLFWGYKYLPLEDCEGFNYETGCPGHEVPEGYGHKIDRRNAGRKMKG